MIYGTYKRQNWNKNYILRNFQNEIRRWSRCYGCCRQLCQSKKQYLFVTPYKYCFRLSVVLFHQLDLSHTLSPSKEVVLTSVVVPLSVPTVSSLLLIVKATVLPLLVVLMILNKTSQPNKRNQLELGSTIQITTTELKPTIFVFSNSVHHSTWALVVLHRLLCQETKAENGCHMVPVSESADGVTQK